MIKRFSLYGFLKNLQFFDPFIILFYIQSGLGFFEIGILLSVRTVAINIIEIPSGAIADLYGRKSAMIISLTSYIISFIVFFMSRGIAGFTTANILFGIGEGFRSGTHKAIIFDWLRINSRLSEKTRIYGYTRSWSKIGSSLSVILSVIIVISMKDYRWIFILSVIPYLAGLINIITYPSYLNKPYNTGKTSLLSVYRHVYSSLKNIIQGKNLRSLVIYSIGFEGVFRVSKEYLQPVLKAQALILPIMLAISDYNRTAFISGAVYFIIYLLSAAASRKSYAYIELVKSLFNLTSSEEAEKRSLTILILCSLIVLLISGLGLFLKLYWIPIALFIVYYILQNIWRPILVSQYDNSAEGSQQATILSIESQSKSLGILAAAPLTGFIADNAGISFAFLFLAGVMFMLTLYSFLLSCKKF
jgi:MFS family permease